MLDVNLLRNQPDVVVEGLAKRGYTLDLSDFAAWDAERRSLLSENESLKAERNRLNLGYEKAEVRFFQNPAQLGGHIV